MVQHIYNFLIYVAWFGIRVASLTSPKLKLFVSGRKDLFKTLQSKIKSADKTIWIHVASLGEFEQGLPVLQAIKSTYSDHKLVLTFFSPSGYEVKKNTPAADVVCYLPFDTRANADRFLKIVQPELALLVKYEIWPNYLEGLRKRAVPTLLISALFSEHQVYFKPWGGYMRNKLGAFSHFFVQDQNSKKLLSTIGFDNATVSGDTRFDRVAEILKRDNTLDFMEAFCTDAPCFVAGSTWPEDEALLVDFINSSDKTVKYVIAPHDIKEAHIQKLISSIEKSTVRYSEIGQKDVSQYEVLVIDTIGLLTKIYSYASFAYVGGGFATGLHNTLEPAAFGIPVIIGPAYKGFKEAEELVDQGGIISVGSAKEFFNVANHFLMDTDSVLKTGQINSLYIKENVGATETIVRHIKTLL
ncbi:3-deoxy-D-manno-octulosonic acid transferase [Flagellimonas lutaonensis]|uniref:3-deoxy-D-manno-octulosonic acid transferase n=1 Tax=Flagellimonas lutaonensis TaxID=516051 RepID=A0A0D5YUA2_9FLAO|nr:glycosyltransferase N-terminal domain-containing protein [Allomuricauda lutaonensis]AKA35466.1 Three-deoxy-D-manno-octulosonic-acid transferase domain-containing protein [Allomuricauda lutaonensis]